MSLSAAEALVSLRHVPKNTACNKGVLCVNCGDVVDVKHINCPYCATPLCTTDDDVSSTAAQDVAAESWKRTQLYFVASSSSSSLSSSSRRDGGRYPWYQRVYEELLHAMVACHQPMSVIRTTQGVWKDYSAQHKSEWSDKDVHRIVASLVHWGSLQGGNPYSLSETARQQEQRTLVVRQTLQRLLTHYRKLGMPMPYPVREERIKLYLEHRLRPYISLEETISAGAVAYLMDFVPHLLFMSTLRSLPAWTVAVSGVCFFTRACACVSVAYPGLMGQTPSNQALCEKLCVDMRPLDDLLLRWGQARDIALQAFETTTSEEEKKKFAQDVQQTRQTTYAKRLQVAQRQLMSSALSTEYHTPKSKSKPKPKPKQKAQGRKRKKTKKKQQQPQQQQQRKRKCKAPAS